MKRSSVFDEIDNTQNEPELSLKAKIGLCLTAALLFALIIGGAWLRESNELAAQTARIEGQKAVAAMMVSWPQRTGKTGDKKMLIPKVIPGGSVQAVLVSQTAGSETDEVGWWNVNHPAAGYSESIFEGGPWDATTGGMVNAPLTDAFSNPIPHGDYYLTTTSPNTVPWGDPGDELTAPEFKYVYRFEVVCMKVTLSLTP